jgi:hypothetical protein
LDTQNLIAALQSVNGKDYEWRFALYSTHKSRDGLQLSWNACAMREVSAWVQQHIRQLLEKTLAERTLTEYSPLLPKEEIGVLPGESELFREQLRELLHGVRTAEQNAPEDFANGVLAKPVGYAFYGKEKLPPPESAAEGEELAAPKEIVLLRRANPFISGGAKSLLCVAQGGEVAESDYPLLKFGPQTDFLFIEGQCVFLSESVTKDFDMESRAEALCNRRLAQIVQAEVVGNFEQFELAALSGRNTRKFLDFDREILDHIAGLSIEARIEFLSTYGVELDAEGKMNTEDPEQCELIIDLLCGRSCLDVLGRLAVGINIKPRE